MKKLQINNKNDQVIDIPKNWWKKPHRSKLRYFIPDWDDLVDPNYDFETDTHSGGKGNWSNQVYSHQLYPEPSYDGILISKVVAEKSQKKKEKINEVGVHRYLRVPDKFPIMGDCGAFSYIMDEVPPFTTNEILEYYTRLGFNYGVSIDHLIVKGTDHQKQERYELTIHNAEEFLKEHKKLNLEWQPIGAVQGWDPQSYAESARQFVAMGYKYIGLGGLVRTSTKEILSILREVHKVVPESVYIHLFGIVRFKIIDEFYQNGVRSIDSASMLRKAWLGADLNYLTAEGWYSAIRIPQSTASPKAKKIVKEGLISLEKLQKLEKCCLEGIRDYAQGRSEKVPDSLINDLVEYDTLVAGSRSKTKEKIHRTLTDKPWQTCSCTICKTEGVEVLIFRGNNRNRRRGFHNTTIFYELIQKNLMGKNVNLFDKPTSESSEKQLNLLKSTMS